MVGGNNFDCQNNKIHKKLTYSCFLVNMPNYKKENKLKNVIYGIKPLLFCTTFTKTHHFLFILTVFHMRVNII